MTREQLAFAAMKPIDLAVGAAISAVKATGQLDTLSEGFYGVAKSALGALYKKQNHLSAEGLENVPAEGGVVFTPNHQSWNDVQVLGATSPRRLRFLAKSEFETWPILRHLIALTDSPFIHRGCDSEGMAQAIEWLQNGKSLVIFPEGTIPGEEEIGREEVEADTGLLAGHTGAVRLAMAAGVPIIPVGISGAGASFPPEVYPRLETLEAPKPVPVTVRYGKAMRFDSPERQNLSHDEVKALTKELMREISALIDHDRNYIPLTLPIQPLPRYKKLGVLLIHGFTSSVRTVDGLVPHLEAAGIPYRMPVLRGHGTTYTDLATVTSQDWYDDAEAALLELSKEVDRVVVVGLSMGGLVTLNLGIRHPDKIAGLVTWAAAMRFKDPLAPVAPMLKGIFPSWPMPPAFADKSLAGSSENYPRMMTAAFGSLLNYAQETEKRLPQLELPICVMQSKADTVIDPIAANLIYREVSSSHREIHWFLRSGHEMGQDLEREELFAQTMAYIKKFKR